MIARKYNFFLFEMLCESVLMTNGEFISLIGRIDSKISKALLDIVSTQKDIKTAYNGLSISDKNDEISFIPDSQFQRGLKSGEDPWMKTKNKAKVGRLIRQILNDNGGEFNDANIEEFVNLFKSEWDKKHSSTKKIEVVTGDKILYWYNQENYESSSGTLGNSCMRHSHKTSFMNIYAENPDKISLVIVTESNKLIARALLWKVECNGEKKIYLDRIYTKNDSDSIFVRDWVINTISPNILYYGDMKGKKLICELKKTSFDEYPYMDTFDNIYHKLTPEKDKYEGSGFVSNKKMNEKYEEYVVAELEDTAGTEYIDSHFYSNKIKKYISKSRAIYIRSIGDYIDKDDAVKCNFTDDYYTKDEVVYSESMQDWIPKTRAINHAKFGLIYDSAVVSAIMDYKGEDKSPITIYKKIKADEMGDFVIEDVIAGKGCFSTSKTPNRRWKMFSESIKVEDSGGYLVPSWLCYKNFRIESELSSEILSIIGSTNYITELEAKFFGVKVSSTRIRNFYVNEQISNNPNDFMFVFEEVKDKYGNDSTRKELEEEYKKIHEYRYEVDGYYRRGYDNEKYFREIDCDKLALEISKEAIKNSMSRSRVFDRFKVPDDIRELLTELLKLYSAIYFVSGSRRTCNNIISKYVKEKMNDIYQELVDLDIFIKLDVIFEDLEERFDDNVYNEIDKYKNDNTYNSDFRSSLAKKCSINNLMDLFSKA